MRDDSKALSRPTSLTRLLRFLVFRLVRLFYPQIAVQGQEHFPRTGPTVFVLNHPNGLLDPILLMLGLERPVSFLAKSTFFGNPLGRYVMNVFGAIPVYRQRDKGKRGGAKGNLRDRNEETFARCRALLGAGNAMALFPEGTTHSEASLLSMRTGAARIALGAEKEQGGKLDLKVVPVGLWYENKGLFRSAVLLVVGEPFGLQDYIDNDDENDRSQVRELTGRIEEELDQVVLQAENTELLSAIPVLAEWTSPEGQAPDLVRQHSWSATLFEAYQRLRAQDPARLEAITLQARNYARLLQTMGVDDPWELELSSVSRWGLVKKFIGLGITLPLAVAGFVMSYIPYRIAGVITEKVTGKEPALIGTIKLIVGSVLVLVFWVLEALAVGIWLGPYWGLGLFLLAPVLGYAALRWGEEWENVRELAMYQWLKSKHTDLVEKLTERRQELAREVMNAVEEVLPAGGTEEEA